MRRFFKILLVVLIVFGVVAAGLILLDVIPLSKPAITSAVMAADVNRETAEPFGVSEEFETNAPAIFCVVKTKSIGGGKEITIKWLHEGYQLAEGSLKVPGPFFLFHPRQLYFELKKPIDSSWTPGDYQAEIYLEGVKLKETRFKVKIEKGQAKEALVESVTLCGKVDANYACQDKKEVFPANTPVIYCSVRLSNAQKGALIKAVWYQKDQERFLDSATYTVQKDNAAGYVSFSYVREEPAWEKGNYEVKIYVGKKLVKLAGFKIK